MNKKQIACVWVGISLVVLLGLFPPWVERADIPYVIHYQKPLGYAFIASPPAVGDPRVSVRIDLSRLLIEWLVVAALTGGLTATLGRKHE